jgi:hypothetical protein
MARFDTELEKGQIAPQARPVEAFIQPSQANVAQPGQLSQMGNPQGIRTISTGGTTFVQGSSSFADFAEALAPFSKNATEFLQNAGLMYAQGQIQQGERRAREEALKALALNDASMESDELKRAAFNRQLASKDPAAGGLLAALNPYQQVGWERGLSKMAAQEAVIGLPTYIAKNADRIKYTAPDQGFGALAQLQAEYTNQLTQKYGIGIGTPGFQKYTLPELEKAQERVQTQHLQDRKTWFDKVATKQVAAEVKQLYANANQSGSVELNGQVYTRAANPGIFWGALVERGRQISEELMLKGSLPGEAGDRAETVYRTLRALADYTNDPRFKYFIDSMPGTEVKRDVNGKTVINQFTQQPERLTWGQQFPQESLDSEIKYGQAGFQDRKRQREEAIEQPGGFEDRLMRATAGMAPGPEKKAAADAVVRQFYEEQTRKGTPVALSDLQKRQKQLMDLGSDLYVQGSDPNAATNYFAGLEERRGSNFDAKAERIRIQEVRASILDPVKREAFTKEALNRVRQTEEDQQRFSGYNTARDAVIGRNVEALLDRNYGPKTQRNEVNRTESEKRMRLGFTTQVNRALLDEEARLRRRLTDSEVREVTQRTVDRYGKGDGGGSTAASGSKNQQRDYLFPGSKFSDEPSVRSSDVIQRNVPKNPDGTPKQQIPAGRYGEKDLDYLPNRKQVLKNFRDEVILSPQAVVRLLDLVADGKPMPVSVQRAWRDAQARNAGEFLLEQADFYRDSIEIPPQLRLRVQQTASREAGAGDAVAAQQATSRNAPLLASLGGWALDALTGAAPATAATMPLPAIPRATYRPDGGGNAPGPGGGGQGRPPGGGAPVAPASPALPAPAGGSGVAVAVAPSRTTSAATSAAMPTAPAAGAAPLPFAPLAPPPESAGPGDLALRYAQPAGGGDGGGGGFLNPVPGVDFRANRGGYAGDTGLDIHGPEGTAVTAAFPGRIVYAEQGHSAQASQSSSSRRKTPQHSVLVELDQPFTFKGKTIRYAWYSHLQGLDPAVAGKNGMRISAGQRLGAMGIANGVSHLHFGLVGDREQRVHLTHTEIRELFNRGGPAAARPTTRPGGGLTGLATYYTGSGGSDGVAGGPTANGERYDPNAMTAAVQWSLRGKYLNKWVQVEDMDTGKTVRVWVNDVGQMGGSRLEVNRRDPRVIDLSPAAFKQLFGSTSRGVGRIRIVEG